MNKYQEALNNIKDISFKYKDTDIKIWLFDRFDGRIALLQELVDRATPKKPINDSCPNCKNQNVCIQDINCDYNFLEYCDRCGQAIDWSETKMGEVKIG